MKATPESAFRRPPAVTLQRVRIHSFTMETLHACIADIVKQNEKAVIANVNLHALNIAYRHPWFAEFLNGSEYVFCDGHGVILAARLTGQRLPEKITYAHWLPLLADFCARQKFSMFLLGGRPGVARRAAEKLGERCPGLVICGTHHGYFDKHRQSDENKRVRGLINRAQPNILITSFGMPMQEKWLMDNWDDVRANVALTGGAALDYAAGAIKRPPLWMTNHGFEWLGRMIFEPSRLWRRYVVGNPLFFMRLAKDLVLKKHR